MGRVLDFFFLLSNIKVVKMPSGSNLCLYKELLKECDNVFHRACVAGGESQPEDLLVLVSVSSNANLLESLLY